MNVVSNILDLHLGTAWPVDNVDNQVKRMTAKELIERLRKLPADRDVMILDGFNGGGEPREINLQSELRISQENADNVADCEGRVGEIVIVFGYGCY